MPVYRGVSDNQRLFEQRARPPPPPLQMPPRATPAPETEKRRMAYWALAAIATVAAVGYFGSRKRSDLSAMASLPDYAMSMSAPPMMGPPPLPPRPIVLPKPKVYSMPASAPGPVMPDRRGAVNFYRTSLPFFLFFVLIVAIGAMVASIIGIVSDPWRTYALIGGTLGLAFLSIMTIVFWNSHSKKKAILFP